MRTTKIASGSDPFKKYWWAVLILFAFIGAWICMPLMDSSVGSGSVAVQEGSLRGPQSLDAVKNPSGAPGGAVDLAMGGSGSYRKKTDGAMTSSLYQAPEEAPATASAAPPPAAGNLADALRDVSRKSAAAAADPSGWGGKAPQKAFTAPKGNFGALSGFSGSSGSGASASSSLSGAGAVGGFGAHKPDVGLTSTKGLRGSETETSGKGRVMNALESARSSAVAALRQGSADGAKSSAGASFDGGGGAGSIGGNMGGVSGRGAYGSLDGAPINLKANDPNLNQRKIEAPPAAAAKAADPNDAMRQQVMMMMVMMVMGGLMGGI